MLCINFQKLSFWINWLCDWNWASVNPLEELCLPYALDIQIKYGLTNQEPQKEPTSRSTWKYNLKKCCFPQICRFSQSATSSRETLGWHRSSHKTGVAAPKQFLPTDPTFTAAAAVTLLILAVNFAADADADTAAADIFCWCWCCCHFCCCWCWCCCHSYCAAATAFGAFGVAAA